MTKGAKQMLSGYVITPTGEQALDLFDRCAEGIGVNPDRTQQSAGRRADVRGNRIDEPAGHLDEKEHPDHSAPSVLIRYAASLDNGRGFAAYDVETLADVLELSRFGQVLSEVQHDAMAEVSVSRLSVRESRSQAQLRKQQAVVRGEPVHVALGGVDANGSETDARQGDEAGGMVRGLLRGSRLEGATNDSLEPNPDDPDSWPVWARPKGPKRQVARGDERFVLLRPLAGWSASQTLRALEAVATVVAQDPTHLFILVETDASWDCPLDPVWDASVVEWRDSRVKVPA